MNRALLKEQAKMDIDGNIGILLLITLIISVLSALADFILSYIPFGGIVSGIIITPAFTLSITRIYLNLTVSVAPETKDAFSGFDDFWSAFKVSFFTRLFTSLWSLLFIVPGIIKSYSYSMATYVLAENPGMPALECIEESKNITDGYKADLFLLGLSFFGWIFIPFVVCLIPLAFDLFFTTTILIIAAIIFECVWVYPYVQATYANAYRELAGYSLPTSNVTDNKETVEMIDATINQDINN